MKFNTRQLVILAVFGALWGLVEISLGSVLHAIRMPMSGVVLSAIGLTIALIGRFFVPKAGSTLFIGLIAMILKLFSIGSVVVGPMIGILAAAIIAEVVLTAAQRPSRPAFLLAGGLAVLWTLIQPFFAGLLLFGRDAMSIWLGLLEEGARLFGLGTEAAVVIVVLLVVVRLLIGAAAGWLAWRVGGLLQTRLGRVQLDSQVAV
jgi:hypothetical protein